MGKLAKVAEDDRRGRSIHQFEHADKEWEEMGKCKRAYVIYFFMTERCLDDGFIK